MGCEVAMPSARTEIDCFTSAPNMADYLGLDFENKTTSNVDTKLSWKIPYWENLLRSIIEESLHGYLPRRSAGTAKFLSWFSAWRENTCAEGILFDFFLDKQKGIKENMFRISSLLKRSWLLALCSGSKYLVTGAG